MPITIMSAFASLYEKMWKMFEKGTDTKIYFDFSRNFSSKQKFHTKWSINNNETKAYSLNMLLFLFTKNVAKVTVVQKHIS